MPASSWKGHRASVHLIASITVLCLTACMGGVVSTSKPHRVDRQDAAGTIHVTILSVAPWDELKQDLQPKFKMTAEQALEAAIPTTAAEEERLLNSIIASVKLAAPSKTSSTSSTTTDGTTTSTSTETTASGDPSKVAHEEISHGDLPEGETVPRTLEKDAMLRHWIATAIYQEVQLLSRYVEKAALRKGYTPYILRLQISLQPSARNEPYDAYTNIAFFPGPASPTYQATSADPVRLSLLKMALEGTRLPTSRNPSPDVAASFLQELGDAQQRVISDLKGPFPCTVAPAPVISPLLVTDDIEGIMHGYTAENVQQLLASLLVLSENFGGNGSVGLKRDYLRSVLARDLNSLLTVARINDNTLRVRFGAVQAPNGTYSMVPQTHNVTLLIMVPLKTMRESCEESSLHYMSKITLVDAVSGKPVPPRSPQQSFALGQRILWIFQYAGVRPKKSLYRYPELYADLLYYAGTNNREAFRWQLKELIDQRKLSDFAFSFTEDALWNEMVNIGVGSQWSAGTFELPSVERPELPEQSVGLVDDGKTVSVTLIGKRLSADGFKNVELCSKGVGQLRALRPTGVAVDQAGEKVKLTFPSVKDQFSVPTALLESEDIQLNIEYNDWRWKYFQDESEETPIHLSLKKSDFYFPKAPDEKSSDSPEVSLALTSQIIRTDKSGNGTITVEFDKSPKAEGTFTFSVQGADIVAVTSEPADAIDAGLRQVNKSGRATLSLRNLLTGGTVKVILRRAQGDAKPTPVGDAKEVLVVR